MISCKRGYFSFLILLPKEYLSKVGIWKVWSGPPTGLAVQSRIYAQELLFQNFPEAEIFGKFCPGLPGNRIGTEI